MTTTELTERPAHTGRRPQSGPRLLIPVLAYAALTTAAVVVNRSTPHPDATGLDVLHYDQTQAATIRLGAYFLFASSVPMAITAAVAYRRLRALGVTAPGSAITLVGGILASGALALSGMTAWSGSHLSTDAGPSVARAFADLSFLAGGPAYAVSLALLIAGISVAGLLAGLLPRALTWAGLALGAVGVLSTLTLVALDLSYLIPVVRFGGTLWLLCAAALLPRTRPRRNA